MSSRDRSRSRRRTRSRSLSRRGSDSRRRSISRRHSPRRSPRRRSSRSHSRSLSRGRRRYGRSRSRSRSRSSKRSRRKSRSSSSSSSDVIEVVPPIRSDEAKYVDCRLFIGRLPTDFTRTELTDYFKRYGQIIDATVHNKGYGFVQFQKREDALTAVEKESGSIIKGVRVDVKMAGEGGRYGNNQNRGPAGRRIEDRREGRAPSAPGRDRSPVRGDPYRDPLPPVPRDDPYFADPYRRPPPPPLDDRFDRFDDPYRRRDPYDDPYGRDPYYPPPLPRRAPPPHLPPPIECEIVILHPQLRGYGEKILDKLKPHKVVCGILSVPADQNIQKQVEDMAKHGVLYAIVVNSQNETHNSVILNILHGTPQEHRNMPLDDAVALVGKDFDNFLRERSEKLRAAVAPPPPAAALPAPFIPPSKDISYLLNLLADNRQLTVPELEKIIVYLKTRRDKLMEVEGRLPPREEDVAKPVHSAAEQEQAELKTKILSILNGGNKAQPPPAKAPLGYGDYDRQINVEPAPPASRPNPNMINFDSPSVQQALDNLIQSGPNLLKNISPGVAQSSQGGNNGRLTTANPSSPGYGVRPPAPGSGYGAAPGGYAARPETDAGYGGHQAGSAQMYGAPGHPPGMRRY